MRSLVAAMMTGDAEEFLLAAYGVMENNEPLNIEATRGVTDATIPQLPQRAGGETSYRSADIAIVKVYINHE